ncbi:MAG: hypothetical protein ACRDJO_05780 [Actinomycetota bacterium]
MGRMLASYLLGFGAVWTAALAGCGATWLLRHRRATDWDLAFVKELAQDTDLAGIRRGQQGDAEPR